MLRKLCSCDRIIMSLDHLCLCYKFSSSRVFGNSWSHVFQLLDLFLLVSCQFSCCLNTSCPSYCTLATLDCQMNFRIIVVTYSYFPSSVPQWRRGGAGGDFQIKWFALHRAFRINCNVSQVRFSLYKSIGWIFCDAKGGNFVKTASSSVFAVLGLLLKGKVSSFFWR